MTKYCFHVLIAIGLSILLSNNVNGDPIPAGDDPFSSTGELTLTVNDPFFPGGFTETISFDSMGSNGMLHRDAQVGDNPGTIDTEIVALTLTGNSGFVGPATVRIGQGAGVQAGASTGQITDVMTQPGSSDPSAFLSGNSFFDVFFEVDLGGNIFYNKTPISAGPVAIDNLPIRATYADPGAVDLFLRIGAANGPFDPNVGSISNLSVVVVPEPSSLGLLTFGGLYLLCRKRKI